MNEVRLEILTKIYKLIPKENLPEFTELMLSYVEELGADFSKAFSDTFKRCLQRQK